MKFPRLLFRAVYYLTAVGASGWAEAADLAAHITRFSRQEEFEQAIETLLQKARQ
jgi:hypothetical protein